MALAFLFLALLLPKNVFAAVASITAAPKLDKRLDVVIGWRLTTTDILGAYWSAWTYNDRVMSMYSKGSIIDFCPIVDEKPLSGCMIKTACNNNKLLFNGSSSVCESPKTCVTDIIVETMAAPTNQTYYACRTDSNYLLFKITKGVPTVFPSVSATTTANPAGTLSSTIAAATESAPGTPLPTDPSLSQGGQSSDNEKHSNTKVIVGGVVGGLAVVGVTVFATVFMLRRRRKDKNSQEGDVGTDPPPEPYYDGTDAKVTYAHMNSWASPAEVHAEPMQPQELPGHVVPIQAKGVKELGGQ